uniref:sodium channel and clathrin linker 1-like n=1 Tax=Myxine glutinosa TaxID=7769 RepID=UPI00358F64EC
MQLRLNQVAEENERLRTELREAVEGNLAALSHGEAEYNPGLAGDLSEQLQLENQGEVLQLRKSLYQMQAMHQKMEKTNRELTRMLGEQVVEMENLHEQLRQAWQDQEDRQTRAAAMEKESGRLRDRLQTAMKDLNLAQKNEADTEERVQLLKSSLAELQGRLNHTEAELLWANGEHAKSKTLIKDFQSRAKSLESQQDEVAGKLQDALILLDQTLLQRDEALLRERQREAEVESLKEAMAQLIDETVKRTRLEVERVRSEFDGKLHHLDKVLSEVKLERNQHNSQLERLRVEKRATDEECSKLHQEMARWKEHEANRAKGKLARLLKAERERDEAVTLGNTERDRLKQQHDELQAEMYSLKEASEEAHAGQAEARATCEQLGQKGLDMQAKIHQLSREVVELKRAAVRSQSQARYKVSQEAREHELAEQDLKTKLEKKEQECQKLLEELCLARTARRRVESQIRTSR